MTSDTLIVMRHHIWAGKVGDSWLPSPTNFGGLQRPSVVNFDVSPKLLDTRSASIQMFLLNKHRKNAMTLLKENIPTIVYIFPISFMNQMTLQI